MRTFGNIASSAAGGCGSTKVSDADASAVNTALHREGLGLRRLVERGPAAWTARLYRTSLNQLALSTRQFALLINAGLTLAEALDTLQEQAVGRFLQLTLAQVRDAVLRGEALADALRRHPHTFSAYFCSMVRAGVAGGALDVVLNRCARFYEQELELRRKVLSALVYPGIVALLGAAMSLFLLVFIVPQFAAFYSDFSGGEAQLPALTRRLVATADWVLQYWWCLPLAPPVLALLAGLRHSRPGRLLCDPLALRLPVFGPLARRVAVTRFTRTLGTLVQSGVPLLEALEVAQATAGNLVVERAIRYIRLRVSEGEPLSTALRRTRVLLPLTANLLRVGEEAGQLEQVLGKLADYYDAEIDTTIRGLAALVEPALLAVLGTAFGAIVVALYLPFFNIVGVIK